MIADRTATAWLRQAERDLIHARRSAAQKDPEWACYAAQQAAEKALKAVLIDLGTRPPPIHDLIVLARLITDQDALDGATMDGFGDLAALTEFNVTARYPLGDGLMAPGDAITPGRADAALATADRVMAFARTALGTANASGANTPGANAPGANTPGSSP